MSRRFAHLASLALIGIVAWGAAGCAGRSPRPVSEPVATTPSTTPPPVAARDSVPRAPAGGVTAPWDTAGAGRVSRIHHVYPKGPNEVGRRLVATLPEPTGVSGGAAPYTPGDAPAPPPGRPIYAPPNPPPGEPI